MCYNCGCGMPNDPMGKGKVSEGGGSLTDDDFKIMADKWKMTTDEAKKHTYFTLKGQIEPKPQEK